MDTHGKHHEEHHEEHQEELYAFLSNEQIDELIQERIDYNALDNTFAGQCIQAGFIAALAAFPKVRLPLLVANVATVAAFNAFDENPRNDLTALVDEEQGEDESVALSWGVIGAVAAGSLAAFAVASRLVDGVAKGLGTRGVAKPNALVGAAAAATYLAVKQLQK